MTRQASQIMTEPPEKRQDGKRWLASGPGVQTTVGGKTRGAAAIAVLKALKIELKEV